MLHTSGCAVPPAQKKPAEHADPFAAVLPGAQALPGTHEHAPAQLEFVYADAPMAVPYHPAAHCVPAAAPDPVGQYVPPTTHTTASATPPLQ